MSAIDWNTIKTALHAWMVASSGLGAERVLFRGQNTGRPDGTGAWISLKFTDVREDGRPWVTYKDNPSPSAGAELLKTTQNQARVTYQATCFPPTPPDDGSSVADASEAHALLFEAVQRRNLDSQKEAFQTAGIGLLKCDPILPIDGVVGSTRFEPRAVLSFSFLVPAQLVEAITYIETVNLEVDATKVDGISTIVRTFTV